MNEEKKVSIILNFYNEEKYLKEAIDSVFDQTYQNFELVLVSDGSTDRSIEIANSYNDPRIKRVYLEKNGGLAAARNAGYEVATGDYIAHFDGDDILLPRKLETGVNYLNEHPDVIVVSGGYYTMDGKGNVSEKDFPPREHTDEEIRVGLMFGNPVANAGASMFRRELIDKYGLRNDTSMCWCEDFHFWHQCLPYGKFANLDTPMFCYRVNYGSNTRKTVSENQKKYDDAFVKVVRYAWNQRGIELTEKEADLLMRAMFRKDPSYQKKKREIKALRDKIERSKCFEEKEKKLILAKFDEKKEKKNIVKRTKRVLTKFVNMTRNA